MRNRELVKLKFGLESVQNELKRLEGRILTIVEATVDGSRQESSKHLVKDAFARSMFEFAKASSPEQRNFSYLEAEVRSENGVELK
jgi:hypothetical protein